MDSPTPRSGFRPTTAGLTPLLVGTALALGLGLTILHPSATRLQAWPWAAFAAAGWLLPIATVLWRLLRTPEPPRLGGWTDAGLLLLAATLVGSALASPHRDLALVAALPALGACALPYALLPFFRSDDGKRPTAVIGAAVLVVLATSLLLWLGAWKGRWPERNEFPFGHGNITGSVGLLATTWLALCTLRSQGLRRGLFAVGALLAVVTTLSSASRGAGLALAGAIGLVAALSWLRRGRVLPFLFVALAALAAVVGSNERLRQLVIRREWSAASRESNDQRMAMITGGLRLGAERPLLGWGPGTVPHVFPRVRAGLPGTADNIVQLHNSYVQTWATLGAAGVIALAVLGLGLLQSMRAQPWTAERRWIAAGLAGGAVVLLFDHPLPVPAFAVLAAAHLAAWSSGGGAKPSALTRAVGWAGLVALLPVLWSVARDLQARSAYAEALDAAATGDRAGYVDGLRRAAEAMPADPYYHHQLAAWFAAGAPFAGEFVPDAATAGAELRGSLQRNPHLEYAHYNLGWLLLAAAPREAATHFLAAARLAPQRGAVYFGLGLARLGEGDTAGAARAFATEFLNDPAAAWSPLWFDGALAPLREESLRLAAAALPPGPRSEALRHAWAEIRGPGPLLGAHRRVRTGYGVLMGHPDGAPPMDVNIQASLAVPDRAAAACPDKGWLRGDFLLEFLSAAPR